MVHSDEELGVIQTLVDRFEKQRLPRLMEIKKRVDAGGVLSDVDIQFLTEVTHDAQQSKSLIDRHEEWQQFCSEVIHLYEEIIAKALDNQEKSKL